MYSVIRTNMDYLFSFLYLFLCYLHNSLLASLVWQINNSGKNWLTQSVL